MSNLIYNQERMLARQRKRLEIARQLNSKLKRKSARMLKVAKNSEAGLTLRVRENDGQQQSPYS
jgi:hypothetical protein